MKKLNNKLTLIIIISLLIVIWYTLYRYQQQQEEENIKIDEYNFEQLETIKSILWNINYNIIQLNTLRELNNYTTKVYPDIIPMKNCYYITTNLINNTTKNNNIKYIIWFNLESNKYKTKYKKDYYTYPENYKFTDLGYKEFLKTISNPCRD